MPSRKERRPAGEILDTRIVDELRESLVRQPDALVDLYRKFLTETASLVHELREQENAARIRSLHMLKGTAGMLGAHGIAQFAGRLQEQFAQSRTCNAAQEITELLCQLQTFERALADHLQRVGHPVRLR